MIPPLNTFMSLRSWGHGKTRGFSASDLVMIPAFAVLFVAMVVRETWRRSGARG